MKVLIAEDDALIRDGLKDILRKEGYEVFTAADGYEAMSAYFSAQPDFLLLDIMMPHLDGYEVCRRVRREDQGVPIIFISAKSEEVDRVVGLELGADDFINKPFGVREVIARIRAVTRRTLRQRAPDPEARPFEMGELRVCPQELRAKRGEEIIDLSLREVRLLTILAQRPGRVIDRDDFFDFCWSPEYMPNSRTLDQAISKLRHKIERDPKAPEIISTVRGVGYRYEPKGEG
ncbi:response regulator transcription factor [Myxococcota bacterium]|nr:response regulator transcription factor [Myxococcota bacterium]